MLADGEAVGAERLAAQPRVDPRRAQEGGAQVGRRPDRPGWPGARRARGQARSSPAWYREAGRSPGPVVGRGRPGAAPPGYAARRGAAHRRGGERVRGDLHPARPAPAVARRGGPLPVPAGGVVGPLVERLPGERGPAVPRRGQPPGVRHARVRQPLRAGGPRQGGGAGAGGAAALGGEPPGGGGHPGAGPPLQEQHRLGGQLLRVPRELPGDPAGRLPAGPRHAHPLLRHPAGVRRGGEGAPDLARGGVLPGAAGRAHLGGRLLGHHPQPARSSTPGTSLTPTPSATGAST